MAEKEVKDTTAAELEINNVKELDEKLADAIRNNDNKPSEEEVKEAEEKFTKASKDFSTKSWDIGEPDNARDHLNYINHFVRNRLFWTKTGWMGVIKMQEELNDAEKFLDANPGTSLKLGYQALEFIFYSFQNPGGVGLQAAQDFEQENEQYAKTFDAIGDNIQEARTELNDIQFLQDQYAAMSQGFYLEVEPPAEDKPEEIVEEEK
jgi:hypothetical protein